MLDFQRFFEIPIYRLSEDSYLAEEKGRLQGYVDAELRSGFGPDEAERRASAFFGRPPWDFNQAVGWLRLVAHPGFVKAYLWWADTKRITANPERRKYARRWKAFEAGFDHTATSPEIFKELRAAIVGVAKEPPVKGRHLDLVAFDDIGRFVDWRGVFQFDS